MTPEEIEEIAIEAAKLYGRDWATLPHYSKDFWREIARHPIVGAPQNDMERCVVEAKERKRAKPEEVKPAEKKSKNKN